MQERVVISFLATAYELQFPGSFFVLTDDLNISHAALPWLLSKLVTALLWHGNKNKELEGWAVLEFTHLRELHPQVDVENVPFWAKQDQGYNLQVCRQAKQSKTKLKQQQSV